MKIYSIPLHTAVAQDGNMGDYRAIFDAEITFGNGGGLQARDFRLDVAGPQVSEPELADLFVGHLGLLMVDSVRVRNVRVVREPHKGSRGGPSDPAGTGRGWRMVELSHPIVAGMTTYPGLPGPEVTPHLSREDSRGSYAPGVEFAIDRVSLVGNTGTYLDSPFHRYADGTDLAGLPLTSFADLPAVVIRPPSGKRAVGPEAFDQVDVCGCAVLLHTGWDMHWGTPAYGGPAPHLTGPGARALADAGAALVGIDSVNIDDVRDRERPAHSILLGADIPVLEHLTGLGALPATGARLHAAPPRLRGVGTFPVRAYALVPS